MNYAVVILAFVMFLATGYWFLKGRKYYTGPRTTAHIVNGGIVEDDSGSQKSTDPEKKAAGVTAPPYA